MSMTHEERFARIEQKLEFWAGNQAQLWVDLQELQQISPPGIRPKLQK